MSNAYTDLEKNSDTSVDTVIVHAENVFEEQPFLNIMLCFSFLFFCLFMLSIIYFNFFS